MSLSLKFRIFLLLAWHSFYDSPSVWISFIILIWIKINHTFSWTILYLMDLALELKMSLGVVKCPVYYQALLYEWYDGSIYFYHLTSEYHPSVLSAISFVILKPTRIWKDVQVCSYVPLATVLQNTQSGQLLPFTPQPQAAHALRREGRRPNHTLVQWAGHIQDGKQGLLKQWTLLYPPPESLPYYLQSNQLCTVGTHTGQIWYHGAHSCLPSGAFNCSF